jgi:3',5'-cyclic-AMP phosphodiesterase
VWELTTVAEDEAVAFDGTSVRRWTDLAPGTVHELDGVGPVRTLDRPPGERLATIATVNDVHLGEVECGILDGWGDPILRVEPGEPPYPEVMSDAAIAEIAAVEPDLVIAKGDLTAHGTEDEYRSFVDRYGGAFGERLLHVRGNHESEHGSPHAAVPVQVREVPGATVVLLDTSRDGTHSGALDPDQLDALDEVARTADGAVLAFGHHHVWDPSTARHDGYFGIRPADSERLLEVVARRPAIAGWFAGHTHRNRVRRFDATGEVPFAEVSAVKDFPGAWAEYRVFEGGVLQVLRRIASPDALAWTERTRVMFAGLYHDYAFGQLEDRCFALPRR